MIDADTLAGLGGRRVVVWGGGVEGRAAVAVLSRWAPPAELVVVQDTAPEADTLDGVPLLAVDEADRAGLLAAAEVVVKSPGVSPYKGRFASLCAQRPDLVVTGGTRLWFAHAAATGALARTVTVTGSKGKSTTSSLIAHLIGAAGEPVVLAGNVGRAPIDLLGEDLAGPRRGWTVLEISSFQAREVRHSAAFGVLTALFPEHLDWHLDVGRYYADKCALFRHPVGPTTVAVNSTNADVMAQVPSLRAAGGAAIGFGGPGDAFHVDRARSAVVGDGAVLVGLDELAVPGEHNAVNLCGALTVLAAAGFDAPAAARAATSFRPLEHRLQVLGRIPGGPLVVDDGLSTAPEAAVAALRAHGGPGVTILLGGHDRELDYAPLARALAERTVPTLVIGMPESGARIVERIAAACSERGGATVQTQLAADLDDAVARARRHTPPDGVILLSPAAPSFGRFANYRARSDRFRELIGPLIPA